MSKSTLRYDGNGVDKNTVGVINHIAVAVHRVFEVTDIAKFAIQHYNISTLQENNSCDYN